MAAWNESVHPRALAAIMSPRARFLAGNQPAARRRIAEIKRMRAAGWPVSHIADQFGIGTARVYQILRRYGGRV